jgi:hypothetical protein
MGFKSPHRRLRRNGSGSTSSGPSGPPSPWSSDFQGQDLSGRPSTPSSPSPSPGASSVSDAASSSSGFSSPQWRSFKRQESMIKILSPLLSPLPWRMQMYLYPGLLINSRSIVTHLSSSRIKHQSMASQKTMGMCRKPFT